MIGSPARIVVVTSYGTHEIPAASLGVRPRPSSHHGDDDWRLLEFTSWYVAYPSIRLSVVVVTFHGGEEDTGEVPVQSSQPLIMTSAC